MIKNGLIQLSVAVALAIWLASLADMFLGGDYFGLGTYYITGFWVILVVVRNWEYIIRHLFPQKKNHEHETNK